MRTAPKAWRFFDPSSCRVTVSRDVVFDEAAQWEWHDHDNLSGDRNEPFVIEYISTEVDLAAGERARSTPRTLSPATLVPMTPVPITPLPDYTDNLDVNHDDAAPLRFRIINDILDNVMPPGLASRHVNEALHFTSAEEPTSFREAEQQAC